jgi:hypothetical protein
VKVNKKRRQLIALAVFLVVVVGFFGAAWLFGRDNGDRAKVGDCVKQSGADSVKIVSCTSPDAAYRVVGRLDNQTQAAAEIDACDPFPGADAVFWEGKSGEPGLVLCLASVG